MAQAPGRAHTRDTALYLLATVVGGTVSGAVLLLVASLVPVQLASPVPLGIAAVLLTVVVVLRDLGVLRFELPQNKRQVRQGVYDYPTAVGAMMFGFEMGTGARTHMTASTPHILLVFAVLADAGPLAAPAAGAAFGLARGLVAVGRLTAPDRTEWDRRLLAAAPSLPWVSSVALGAVLVAVALA